MRCPKCSTTGPCEKGAKCRECDYQFGLDPKQPHGLGDADYLELVNQASAGGQLYFTANQFYFHYCSQRMPQNIWWPFGAAVGAGLGYYNFGLQVAAASALVIAGLIYYGTKWWSPPGRMAFENLHTDMKAAGSPIGRYIAKPLFEFRDEDKYTSLLPRASETDNVIIVERDVLVDLLMQNGFAKRNRAVVISQTGYPNFVTPAVQELLARRKSISIYLLHDSTDDRLMMKRNIADLELIPTTGHRVFNLGIEPEQVIYMKQLAPISPGRSGYRIPIDSIPYTVLDAALSHSIKRGVPLLTAFAKIGYVERT
ncbi:MAG: hypothetical protein ACI8W3_002167 [Myxococcota bacterium]